MVRESRNETFRLLEKAGIFSRSFVQTGQDTLESPDEFAQQDVPQYEASADRFHPVDHDHIIGVYLQSTFALVADDIGGVL